MPAYHKVEDQIVEIPWPPYIEPTPEAFGVCGRCGGDGRDCLEDHLVCGHCGGDGKSILTVDDDQMNRMRARIQQRVIT